MIKKLATRADVEAIEAEMPVTDRWNTKTVFECLSQTEAKFGNRPAVSFQMKSGAKDKKITLNYSELKSRVIQAANLFRSLGVGETDAVAYLLPSTHETLITMLGGMTAGIVAPINPTLEPEKIAGLLRESGAKVLVTLKAFPKTEVAQLAAAAVADAPNVETVIEIDLLPHLAPPLSWIVPLIRPKNPVSHQAKVLDFNQAMAEQNADRLDFEESAEDRFCAVFHTGGTTGTPKMAQHRHSGILYQGWLGSTLLMDETACVMCPMPLFHVFAAYPAWLSCMAAGSHMVMPTPAGYRGDGVFDNFWKLIERYKCTFVIIVPTAASVLMQKPVNADISSLQSAFCGSAPLPVELYKRFQETTGVSILEGYGMTEATCLISCNPSDGERRIGSVGLALPYTDVKILTFDNADNVTGECAVGEVGEICVSNHGVVEGATYTDPSKNVGLFAYEKYMRTGDLGRLDEDSYLWITGRAKDLIIRGGHNIDPAIIEEALASHPSVALAGAIGQPDAHSGELPCAYVELIEGADVSIEELTAFAKEHVDDPTARPKYIEVVDTLPKTAVGKIFKPDLRRMAITRVYDAALAEADLPVGVDHVVEDKKLGLVAVLDPLAEVDDAQVTEVLGSFIRPWRWLE